MKIRATLLMSVSAIGVAISAPAMAQTILNPQSVTGSNLQSSFASLAAIATGLTALAAGNQFSANAVNQIGNGASAVSVLPNFSFGQVIGTSVAPNTTLNQSIINLISASSSSGLLANVTAGLSGGNQTASNAGNSATFGLLAGSTGTLQQVVFPSNPEDLASTTQVANNSITATANGGNSSILGGGASQIANNSLNSAALVSAGVTSLALDQKSIGTVGILNNNFAMASVANGGNPVIDPLISGLNQSASFSLNTVSSQGGQALTLTNAGAIAGQALAFFTSGSGSGTSTINTSNVMEAYTGALGTPGDAGPPVVLAVAPAPGTGTSNITGISQANRLTLNQAVSTGATTYGDIAQPFAQSINTTGLTVSGSGAGTALLGIGLVYDSSANLLVARTDAGGASITGSNTAATQLNNVGLNNVASTGQVNGYLTQAGTGGVAGLDNTALASTRTGAASLSGVSQGQNLSLNTMSGAGGTGFTLDQSATGASFAGDNVQRAQTTIGIATLSGGLQQSTSSVNVATLGAIGNGSILQSAANTMQNMGNTLLAAGGAAQVGGSQSSINTVNAIR